MVKIGVKVRALLLAVCAATMCMRLVPAAHGQQNGIRYGDNLAAGHFLQVDDAKIYYETYGRGGTPLVLLHGGMYGYIEEFGALIDAMSKDRRVIAIATRGHGKSEIGTKTFSYALFADDAVAVIRHEGLERVDVLGFSDGAVTSYVLSANHPQLVRRLVAIGGPRKFTDWTPGAQAEQRKAKPEDVERDSPDFVAARKKLMPEPQRWREFIDRLNHLYVGPPFVTDAQIHSIEAPTLTMAGDHDPYNQLSAFVEIFQLLPKGELALIPGCGHVVLECKGPLTIEIVKGFFDRP